MRRGETTRKLNIIFWAAVSLTFNGAVFKWFPCQWTSVPSARPALPVTFRKCVIYPGLYTFTGVMRQSENNMHGNMTVILRMYSTIMMVVIIRETYWRCRGISLLRLTIKPEINVYTARRWGNCDTKEFQLHPGWSHICRKSGADFINTHIILCSSHTPNIYCTQTLIYTHTQTSTV